MLAKERIFSKTEIDCVIKFSACPIHAAISPMKSIGPKRELPALDGPNWVSSSYHE
jgi:hypothetical protein